MKVAVIGGNGQLGRDVASAFSAEGCSVTSLTHEDMEISSLESVRTSLGALQPEVVVNTAAFHNVDKCEAEPGLAFAINGIGARNLAQMTEETGATLLHVSTDYVFDGQKGAPYVEEDMPAPLNVYGNTKLAGEFFVRSQSIHAISLFGLLPSMARIHAGRKAD